MLLLSSKEVIDVHVPSRAGMVQGIAYQGRSYLTREVFLKHQDAVSCCRRHLDAGRFSIVVQGEQHYKVCEQAV